LISYCQVPGFSLNIDTVKFEYVEADEKHYEEIKLLNTGTKDIHWQLPIQINDDFDIMSIDPNPTPPNTEADITIRFNGGIEGDTTLFEYLLSESMCGRNVKLILQAIVGDTPVDAYAYIKVDSSIKEFKPGEIVKIPIYLKNHQNLEEAKITGFTGDLKLNATLLLPIGTTNMGTRIDDERTIQLTLPAKPINSDILQVLEFQATLGNDTTTALTLENLISTGVSIDVTSIDGRFTLDGICMEGGYPRLISTEGDVNLSIIRPNPTSESFSIDYEVVEDAQTEIYIVNSFGERVKTLVNGEIKHGKHSEEVSVSELSSGLYFIILETPTVRRAVKVEIVK